jgi:hypothetical protein
MQSKALSELNEESLKALLKQIPFFNDLALQSQQQFNLLLEHSRIIELDAAEVIIKKGTIDKIFYFLLEGKLDVFPEEEPSDKAIGELSQGQVFGALSIINEQPRTATLAASNLHSATVFATDFNIFGELDDFSQISLATKLSFLRIVVNNTRWKLEVNKMNDPENPLARKLDAAEKFTGEKGHVEELEALAEQAFFYGQLLDLWNNVTPASIDLPHKTIPIASKKEKILSFFSKKKA